MNKTIFRLTTAGLMLAGVIAFGAAAGFAQDPCTDAAGQTAMQDEYDKLWAGRNDPDPAKAVENRKQAINSGKAFLDKYGACASAELRATWLKTNLPKQEETVKKMGADAERGKLVNPFNTALKNKALDDMFNYGGQILTKWPEDYRPLEIALATIAGDEATKGNFKYMDNGLRYAKLSLADLDAGKSFILVGDTKPQFGIGDYGFKDKNYASGYMNLYIGTMMYNGQKNKAGALPYLYKSTQLLTDQPSPYVLIAGYYIDQLNAVVEEIKTLTASQDKPGITADEIKAIVEQIKGKVALQNGYAERIADAYSRAYKVSADAAYKAKMKDYVTKAYFQRFGKNDGVDAWMASAVAKPFVDPTTPVTPVSDPEPTKTTTSGTAATATPAPVNATPATTTTTVKATTAPAPAKTTTTVAKKPGIAAIKPVAKKAGA